MNPEDAREEETTRLAEMEKAQDLKTELGRDSHTEGNSRET